ncbi:MAG TPA: FAD:protein FMN transferase [Methylomirabilota bacterium]|nr:FAD:protein FMN transferase [Methylomirabilota bacterium]
MTTVAVARHAMATRFEIVLHGGDPAALRAAGEEALDEIERLEARLSLYRPTSEIAHVNARAAVAPVRVSPEVFGLVERAQRLWSETEGAFDITVGPLMRCWGFMGGNGRMPEPAALAEARSRVGMHWVELDSQRFTIRFHRDGVMLDLGAIGKGYAIDVAAGILREAGVQSAFLHGGTSTIYALGKPPDREAWKAAVERPPVDPAGEPELLAVVPLCDEALSVSAVWGKAFQTANKTFGHVIDPRTGEPTQAAMLAAVALPDATDTDALSTALLTAGPGGVEAMTRSRPGMRSVVLFPGAEGGLRRIAHGLSLAPA